MPNSGSIKKVVCDGPCRAQWDNVCVEPNNQVANFSTILDYQILADNVFQLSSHPLISCKELCKKGDCTQREDHGHFKEKGSHFKKALHVERYIVYTKLRNKKSYVCKGIHKQRALHIDNPRSSTRRKLAKHNCQHKFKLHLRIMIVKKL